ncbi:TPA: DUF896 domain-containing protein [Streptococcus suis]
MLSKEKLERINQLAKLSKERNLYKEELEEQKALREEYLFNLRKGFKNHIEGLKIVDEEGNDVTPDKLKAIQKDKKIHNRHLDV